MNTVCAIADTPPPQDSVPAAERWLFTIENGPKPAASRASPEATRTTLCSTRRAGTPGTNEGAVYAPARLLALPYNDRGFVNDGGVAATTTMPPRIPSGNLILRAEVPIAGFEHLVAADIDNLPVQNEDAAYRISRPEIRNP